MSDLSYTLIRALGMPIVWVTSRPIVLHRERAAIPGGFILAANHLSPYDVPGLMAVSPRPLDFLSIVEFRDKPLVGQFFRAMNCTFLDRGRTDPAATRELATRLSRGRVVAMFPEAGFRTMENSVLTGAPFKPGVIRLAQLTGVPIVPCAIVGTGIYSKFSSWYPFRAVRFGVAFGELIRVPEGPEARSAATAALKSAYVDLFKELTTAGAGGRHL
jgi:1-acyl-sn-glycerol-3-phosphate acyltransferase